MTGSTRTQCDSLDMIRALAAAAVCVSHLRNLIFVDYRPGMGFAGNAFYFFSNYGHAAVIVFFVLSGYFVGGSVMRQVERGTWSWRGYLGERLSRLWMVLIPALALTYFFDHLGLSQFGGPFYLGTEGNFDQRANVANQLGAGTFICNVAFLQTLACGTFGSNGALWSLANEFWYYLWFPALYVLARGRRGLPVWMAGAAALGSMFLFQSIFNGFTVWLLGALAALIEQRFPASIRQEGAVRWMTWTSGMVFVVALFANRYWSTPDWITGGACFLFVCSVVRERTRLPFEFLSRTAIRFSAFSYSLYLTHVPLILFVVSGFPGHRVTFGAQGIALFLALLVACYVYAFAVYVVFERNTRRLQHAIQRFHLPPARSVGPG